MHYGTDPSTWRGLDLEQSGTTPPHRGMDRRGDGGGGGGGGRESVRNSRGPINII